MKRLNWRSTLPALGIWVLACLAVRGNTFRVIGLLGQDALATAAAVLALLILALGLTAGGALLAGRTWGISLLYPLLPIATLFFSIPFVPFLDLVLPAHWARPGLLAADVVLLIGLALWQRAALRTPQR